MKKLLAISFFTASMMWGSSVLGQIPTVVSVSPTQDRLISENYTGISVTFNVDMDETTVDAASFIVFGSLTGRHQGTIDYDNSTRAATFHPSGSFMGGEMVTVVLSIGVQSVTGEALDGNHVWSFRIAPNDNNSSFTPRSEYLIDGSAESNLVADPENDGDAVPGFLAAGGIKGRGDVNLNGVPNEIGDAIVFTNYFIYGLAAFRLSIEAQMAATDTNADGMILTVADLVYLLRVIIGDASPYPKAGPGFAADVVVDSDVVSIDAEIGAVFFVLAGDVDVSLSDGAAGMTMSSHFDGINTRVLIYSYDEGRTASGDILKTNGSIISAEASDYYGNAYRLTVPSAESDLVDPSITTPVVDRGDGSAGGDVKSQAAEVLPFEIVIELVEDQYQGHHGYIDVVKQSGSERFHGFDFLIGYDASALDFRSAVGGELFNMSGAYQWEYFTYRYDWNGNCGSACPTGLLRVVGMAEQNDGAHHPFSVDVPDDMTLFTLDFLVSNDRTYECMFVPIYFYWMDCGDNTVGFSFDSENKLDARTAISTNVYHYYSHTTPDSIQYYEVTDGDFGFPTYFGAQYNCPEMGNPYDPDRQQVPFAKFYGGGFIIICADSIDVRGDVNLNGVPNEIADAAVFSNYFVYGLRAFTVDIEGQTAATEINGDGMVLSVADLVYLIRIIIGDALPLEK